MPQQKLWSVHLFPGSNGKNMKSMVGEMKGNIIGTEVYSPGVNPVQSTPFPSFMGTRVLKLPAKVMDKV